MIIFSLGNGNLVSHTAKAKYEIDIEVPEEKPRNLFFVKTGLE